MSPLLVFLRKMLGMAARPVAEAVVDAVQKRADSPVPVKPRHKVAVRPIPDAVWNGVGPDDKTPAETPAAKRRA